MEGGHRIEILAAISHETRNGTGRRAKHSPASRIHTEEFLTRMRRRYAHEEMKSTGGFIPSPQWKSRLRVAQASDELAFTEGLSGGAMKRGCAWRAAGTSELDLVGARGFEPPTSCSQSRRATGLRYAPTFLTGLNSVGFVVYCAISSALVQRLLHDG